MIEIGKLENPLSKALLCTTLDSINPVLYPSTDTILCVLLSMPVESATAEMSFSVLRRLKTCDPCCTFIIIILFSQPIIRWEKSITSSEKFQTFNRKIVEIGNYEYVFKSYKVISIFHTLGRGV
jgi:hypothetical protein